jgi:hypothetical protein
MAPPRHLLLLLLLGFLAAASLAFTLTAAVYEDQVGLADWCVLSRALPTPISVRHLDPIRASCAWIWFARATGCGGLLEFDLLSRGVLSV